MSTLDDTIKLPPLPEPDHFAFHDFGQGIWIEGGPTGEPFYSEQQVQELMREAVRLNAQAAPQPAQQPLTDAHKAILKKCRNQASRWALEARIPEAGVFGEIAQDLDYLCGQLGARHD